MVTELANRLPEKSTILTITNLSKTQNYFRRLAAAVGDVGTGAQLAAGIVGGALATGSHITKAGSRVLINTSPEPVTNWFASVGEDVMVILGLWTALYHPVLFLVLLALFILLMIWLAPKIWRGIKKVFAYLGSLFGNKKPEEPLTKLSDMKPKE